MCSLPNRTPEPYSRTTLTLPNHTAEPYSRTTLPNNTPEPRSRTTIPNNTPEPRSRATLPNHAPEPRSRTVLPNHAPEPYSRTTLPNHAPEPRSRTTLPAGERVRLRPGQRGSGRLRPEPGIVRLRRKRLLVTLRLARGSLLGLVSGLGSERAARHAAARCACERGWVGACCGCGGRYIYGAVSARGRRPTAIGGSCMREGGEIK